MTATQKARSKEVCCLRDRMADVHNDLHRARILLNDMEPTSYCRRAAQDKVRELEFQVEAVEREAIGLAIEETPEVEVPALEVPLDPYTPPSWGGVMWLFCLAFDVFVIAEVARAVVHAVKAS